MDPRRGPPMSGGRPPGGPSRPPGGSSRPPGGPQRPPGSNPQRPTQNGNGNRLIKEDKPVPTSRDPLDALLPASFQVAKPSTPSSGLKRTAPSTGPRLASGPSTSVNRPGGAPPMGLGSFQIPKKKPATEAAPSTSVANLQGELVCCLPFVCRCTQVTSNSFIADFSHFKEPLAHQYRIEFLSVRSLKSGIKTSPMFGKPVNQTQRNDRRQASFHVFVCLINRNPEIFGPLFNNVYDNGNIYYSFSCSIQHNNGEVELELQPEFIDEFAREEFGGDKLIKIIAKIQWARAFDPRVVNADSKALLEVLTMERTHYEGDHVNFGNKFFRKARDDDRDLRKGRVARKGFEKSVNPAGSLADQLFHLQIDPKTAPFEASQPVIQTMADVLECQTRELERRYNHARSEEKRAVKQRLRNLVVETTHLPRPQKHNIADISEEAACDIRFDLDDGKSITVADYYQKTRNIRLRYPNLPCIMIARFGGQFNYFPPEVLVIREAQKVPTSKLTGNDQEKMIKETQCLPEQMKQRIATMKSDGRLDARNEYLQAWGVQVSERPIDVTSTQLFPPAIAYENQKVQPFNDGRMKWDLKGKQFLVAGSVQRWVFVIFDNCVQNNTASQFTKRYTDKAREFGVTMGPSRVEEAFSEDVHSLREKMIQWRSQNVELVMAVTRIKNDPVHEALKMLEAETGLLTQDMAQITFNKAMEKHMVLENLIVKTNPKIGGVNHNVEIPNILNKPDLNTKWLGPQRMFVGIDHSHPGALSFSSRMNNELPSDPTVIGMAYSVPITTRRGAKVRSSRGTFWFQEPRFAGIHQLKKYFTEALVDFKNNATRFPEDIIVFRGGTSEGEFAKVVDAESTQLIDAWKSLNPSAPAPRIVIMVVSEHSNTRLMPAHGRSGPPSEQNVRPGTVVDKQLTNPNYREFIIVPHRAIQGTSRPIKCTVVMENRKGQEMQLDEAMNIFNALCYEHQASYGPVSLPAPLYAATNLSKRGRNNWKSKSDECDERTRDEGGLLKNDGSADFFEAQSILLQPKNKRTQYFA